MRALPLSLIIVCSLAAAAAAQDDPAAAWEAFGEEAATLMNRGPGAARRVFEPAYWRGRESPRGELREIRSEGLTLSFVMARVGDDPSRAVIQLDVLEGERRADSIFLYAVESRGRRRVHYIDESRCHADGFLAGTLPPAPPRGQRIECD